MKMRVFTAFSGYDSQCLALDRLKRDFPNFDYELVGWAEIDKYAIQAHNALYPQWEDRNYGDISKIDWDAVPDFDLFTYSSPCQDFSNAGLQRGGEEGSGTRSSILWECRRAIIAKKPKYLLLENVAALVSHKFLPLFNKWQAELEGYGYSNFARVLNAKDYGVPQNRERVFLVSIRDVDARYSFPPTMPLDKRLKDVLEQNVDERYYLSDRMITGFMRTSADTSHGHNFTPKGGEDVAFTIRTAPGQRVDDNFIKEKGGVTITSINHVSHVAPSGSSGTGYSEYDILEIQYSNGEKQRINLYTWYMSKERIIEDFTAALRYDINDKEQVVMALFEALKGYVPDNYIKK